MHAAPRLLTCSANPHRVKYYERSIRRPEAAEVKAWIEIGPGALGVLTVKLLERDQETMVLAIETVKESVKGVLRRLAQYVQAKRLKVSYHSFASTLFSLTLSCSLARLSTALRVK